MNYSISARNIHALYICTTQSTQCCVLWEVQQQLMHAHNRDCSSCIENISHLVHVCSDVMQALTGRLCAIATDAEVAGRSPVDGTHVGMQTSARCAM
jgi:hypothetical protein